MIEIKGEFHTHEAKVRDLGAGSNAVNIPRTHAKAGDVIQIFYRVVKTNGTKL